MGRRQHDSGGATADGGGATTGGGGAVADSDDSLAERLRNMCATRLNASLDHVFITSQMGVFAYSTEIDISESIQC
ncbi:hypothetical protein Tco_1168213 [Tanacetum coccineum]